MPNRKTNARVSVLLLAAAPLCVAQSALAQDVALSYTAAQAEAGRRIYDSNCTQCHGPNLDDGPLGAPLRGPAFMSKYGGGTVARLLDVTRTTMPTGNPGSLSATEYTNLVALILQANDIIAAQTVLPSEPAALTAMRIPEGGFSFMAFSPYTERESVELPNPLDDYRSVSDRDIANPPDADWLTWRRGYDAHGFSPLDEIDARNVDRLQLAWSWTLPAGSTEGVPLVRDGTMFMQGYGDTVHALDARTGELLWEYRRTLDEGATPFHKRGLALNGDRLYIGTSDVHVVALDVHTGTVLWDRRIGDFHIREGLNGGPLVAKGKVMVGTTGTGVGAKPGGPQIVGLDAGTGEIVWRIGTIARPGEPGGDSWNGVPFDERSGASVWTPGSFDPETGLAYFGTGNTYDTGPLLQANDTPGVTNDALYTNSTLAVDPDTGALVWYRQHFPNDQWDLDWAFERQIIELPLNGRQRKLVLTAGKIGIYEAVDAETGEFAFAIDLGLQNIVKEIDARTGEKTVDRSLYPGRDRIVLVCPHGAGAKNFLPASYNGTSHRLFIPLNEACMDVYPVPGGGTGGLSSGVNWGIRPRPDSDGNYGRLEAIDLVTQAPAWIARQRAPLTSGVLSTAGGLVFVASLDRYFTAHDQRNGSVLWQTRLNDVSSSSPIAYSVDGKQYVAIVVGEGGFHARSFAPLVPEIKGPQNRGAAVWVFTLPQR